MGRHCTPDNSRISAGRAGSLLLAAVASGVLATVALGSAGTADASCASLNGVGIGHGCTTTKGNVALGIGRNAQASSTGGAMSSALAIGRNSTVTVTGAYLSNGVAAGRGSLTTIYGQVPGLFPTATVFNNAIAIGAGSWTEAGFGSFNNAIAIGNEAVNNTPVGQNGTPPTSPHTYGGAFGSFSNALSIGNGAVANSGTTTSLTTPPIVSDNVFNNALAIGRGSGAVAGTDIAGTPTGSRLTAVAIGRNKYVQK